MTKNITLAIDDETLAAARAYAKRHDTSVNALVRELLAQRVGSRRRQWIDQCFEFMDKANGDSQGKRWRREDLYRV